MRKTILAAIAATTMCGAAQATVTVYTDRASFIAASSAGTTASFDSYASRVRYDTAPVDVGPFTVSFSGTSPNPPQNYIGPESIGFAVNGTPAVSVRASLDGAVVLTFDDAINAFGADFREVNDNGQNTGFTLEGTRYNVADGFYGFITTSSLKTLSISSFGDDGYAFDNATFRTAGTAAVPEPATWAMMILGFGVVGYSLRRKAVLRFV